MTESIDPAAPATSEGQQSNATSTQLSSTQQTTPRIVFDGTQPKGRLVEDEVSPKSELKDPLSRDFEPTSNLSTSLHQAGNHKTSDNALQGKGKEVAREGPETAIPSHEPHSQSPNKESSPSTIPQGRRSVQFARSLTAEGIVGQSHSRQGSLSQTIDNQVESPTKERGAGSLFLKLKNLVPSSGLHSHQRTQSGLTVSGSSVGEESQYGALSPGSDRIAIRDPNVLHEESSDADAEDSGRDDNGGGHRKRRKFARRSARNGIQTEPTTPRAPLRSSSHHFSNNSEGNTPTTEIIRPFRMRRRATMTDLSDQERDRGGVSEGEGRDRLARSKPSAWRRGSNWVQYARGQNSSMSPRPFTAQNGRNEGKRPSTLRRLTGFGAHEGGSELSLGPKRRMERSTTISAARWRKLRAGLRMMGKQKREEKIDQLKSIELLAELHAGAPAALILASMFQRDDRGNRRIPVLLEQVKLRVTDSQRPDYNSSSERHQVYRIELEYGSGLTRMKWVIHRSLRDFFNLHARYWFQSKGKKNKNAEESKNDDPRKPKVPHFPTTAVPYMRGIRGINPDEDNEDGEGDDTAPSGTDTGTTPAPRRVNKRQRSSSLLRRLSSVAPNNDTADENGTTIESSSRRPSISAKKEALPERQRRKLEEYLQKLIRSQAFRAENNRICKFLELSALGVRLAAEGSYHGKEGYMAIYSSKGIDQRRNWQPQNVFQRNQWKWFMVRHSYIVCVASPEQTELYDVFLVDEDFKVKPKTQRKRDAVKEKDAKQFAKSAKETGIANHHFLTMYNGERKLQLQAKNDRQTVQFERSLKFMVSQTAWAEKHRFGSFAPVRRNVFARWLVDGRDHMWNVSRAISMARNVIYIHDWWLSPELYMRRPPAISQKWRLDRLLQRKAQEGVKVFVIVYRNIDSAIPIDSQYTKFSLLDLHQNIFVQRSPNQARQGAFFWAHHEKICIVDHTVAFVGGIDLCFGRWDTPQHSVTDDKLTGYEASEAPKDADHCQLWPGKDYSNPRIQDFYSLDKPYEEMYDRTKVARMPWHDISMQIVGQPAKDLTRHFVQRWNFILRQRTPSRPTPFLVPPNDFNPAELETLGLNGTCEIQILRSCGQWSIGYLTKNRVEHSIMTAYAKMIEESEHFVYMENQFFITSCEVMGSKIENIIGDALVERIIRAHQQEQDWRAVILIPLLPGFQNTVDEQDGTSVRLIMQCQLYSICRGETSIFGRLRAQGIEPEDYIQFYSLRSWGRIGPTKTYVTEQLYIHAKCMIVDDRIAIIGSANINERSMLGSRDSETAAVVRDSDMIQSTMGGKPYLVGRFPHTLRKRLMREHLGLDVDCIEEEERALGSQSSSQDWERDMDSFHGLDGNSESDTSLDAVSISQEKEERIQRSRRKAQDQMIDRFNRSVGDNPDPDADWVHVEADEVKQQESEAAAATAEKTDFPSLDPNVIGTNLTTLVSTDLQSNTSQGYDVLPPFDVDPATVAELDLLQLSQLSPLPVADDVDIGGPPIHKGLPGNSSSSSRHFEDVRFPVVEKDSVKDPLVDSFYLDIWHTVAENNTKIFRDVFRCMPDNEVKTWKEYQQYTAYSDAFAAAQGAQYKRVPNPRAPGSTSGPPGQGAFNEKMNSLGMIGELSDQAERKVEIVGGKIIDKISVPQARHHSDETASTANESNRLESLRASENLRHSSHGTDTAGQGESPTASHAGVDGLQFCENTESAGGSTANRHTGSQRRRRRGTTRSSRRDFNANDGLMSWPDVKESLDMIQGHLVIWPYDWLEKEDKGGNWLYNIDQLAPLEIYN